MALDDAKWNVLYWHEPFFSLVSKIILLTRLCFGRQDVWRAGCVQRNCRIKLDILNERCCLSGFAVEKFYPQETPTNRDVGLSRFEIIRRYQKVTLSFHSKCFIVPIRPDKSFVQLWERNGVQGWKCVKQTAFSFQYSPLTVACFSAGKQSCLSLDAQLF